MTKINLRITAKPHAHSQTLTKTHAKFQKDPAKSVGGVAFTRLYTIFDGQSNRQTDAQGKTICLPTLDGGVIIRGKTVYWSVQPVFSKV